MLSRRLVQLLANWQHNPALKEHCKSYIPPFDPNQFGFTSFIPSLTTRSGQEDFYNDYVESVLTAIRNAAQNGEAKGDAKGKVCDTKQLELFFTDHAGTVDKDILAREILKHSLFEDHDLPSEKYRGKASYPALHLLLDLQQKKVIEPDDASIYTSELADIILANDVPALMCLFQLDPAGFIGIREYMNYQAKEIPHELVDMLVGWERLSQH